MEIEIYVDILFFINLVMIYFIFFITNKLLKNKQSLKRLFFSAILTSIFYIITIIFIPYNKVYSKIIPLLIFVFSIIIAFNPKTIKQFFKIFFITNIVTFFIGGFSISLFYYTKLGDIFTYSLNNFPIKILVVTLIFTYILLKLSLKTYSRIFIKNQKFYEINLYKNNMNIKVNALLDSGNNLKEPITKKPVTVCNFEAIKPILPENLKLLFYQKEENNLNKLLTLDLNTDIRFIPFKSIGEENGILIGIKLDKIEILDDEIKVLKNPIIAISPLSLCNDNFYNALLNPELIK